MTTCLVTGGAGFIGSHLVEALVQRGDTVRVLDDLSTGHRENLADVADEIEFIEGQVQDEATVRQAAEEVDTIFHLGAMVSVPQSMLEPAHAETVNTLGTLNVLLAARDHDVQRVILSSTCAVYGDEPTLPKTEAMPPQPKSPYAISKLSAEQYCQLFSAAFELETVIFRYFNVFGPRQDPSSPYSGVISIFADKLSEGKVPTIFGDGHQTRDFVYVADVVRANLLAADLQEADGQIFNIGTGQQTSVNHLFDTLAAIFDVDKQPLYAPPRKGDILHSYANAGLARQALGWSPQISLDEGLRRLADSL